MGEMKSGAALGAEDRRFRAAGEAVGAVHAPLLTLGAALHEAMKTFASGGWGDAELSPVFTDCSPGEPNVFCLESFDQGIV